MISISESLNIKTLLLLFFIYSNASPTPTGAPPASSGDPYRGYGGGAPSTYPPPPRPYTQPPAGTASGTPTAAGAANAPPSTPTGAPGGPYPPPSQQFDYRPDQVCSLTYCF